MKLTKQILEAIDRGIQLALDDFEDNEPNSSLSQHNDVIDSEDVINVIKQKHDLMKEVVDLGLPSRTLWCKYNLGVDPNKLSKPEDWYGDYYAWGEIIPNKPDGYNWKTYQFDEDLTKYNKEDHLTELQFMDDPVYQNMYLYNFKFHMPTKADFEELIKETNNKWVRNFNDSGVNGYKFINKLDSSKYIFLPAAGSFCDWHLCSAAHDGVYWSSSLDTDEPDCALYLYFFDGVINMGHADRPDGSSVRPVINLK